MFVTQFINMSPFTVQTSPAYLKGVWRVVYTVHSQVVVQRIAGHAPERGQLQTLDCSLCQGLTHQGVGARLLQQEEAAVRVYEAVTACRLVIHRHHFLQGKRKMHCNTVVVDADTL